MSSPSDKNISEQPPRRGVQFPQRGQAAQQNLEPEVVEQKEIVDKEGSPPKSPRYSSDDDSEEKREIRRRSSRSDDSLSPYREINATFSDDGEECEILSSNVDEPKKDVPGPPEGKPPAKASAEKPRPPAGAAPEAPVAKQPKKAQKAEFPYILEIALKTLNNLPQEKWFAADQSKMQLCNTCNKEGAMKSEVEFRGKKVVTCSDSCLIKNLQMRTSPPANNDMEHTEMKRVAIAFARNEHNTLGCFKPLKPYHDEIIVAKKMREAINDVEKATKGLANGEPMPIPKIRAHRASLEALRTILKNTYKEYIDNGTTIFGEDLEEVLENYFIGNPKAKREVAQAAKKTAEKTVEFETKKKGAEDIIKDLKENLLPKMAELLGDAPDTYKQLKRAKETVAKLQEELVKSNQDFVDSLDEDKDFADAMKIRKLTDVLLSLKELAKKEKEHRDQQATEAEKARKLENKAFELLTSSNFLKDDEKENLKHYEKDFNDEGPPFGTTYFKYKDLINEIQEMLYLITDFAVLKQEVAHYAQEDALVIAASNLRCRLEDEERQKYSLADSIENKTLKAQLETNATKISDLQKELVQEKAAKERALADAEEKAGMLFDSQTRLAELQSFKEMALNIGEKDRRASRGGNDRREEKGAPDEDNEWREVKYNRGGNRPNPRAQGRDNRDDQRKRGPDEYSHFGLRDKDNNPFCQFQFTNAEGCNKKDKCRYANTHGMDDPHPGHESRNRCKRPKKGAAHAAKDEKPRDAKRDDRDRDEYGVDNWGDRDDVE